MYPFSNPSLIAHIKLAQEFYIQDKLNEAMEVVTDAFSTTGWPIDAWTDFYNTLVCEKDARDSAVLHKVHDKLSIELDLDAPPSIYEDLKALLAARVELRQSIRLVADMEKQIYATPKSRAGMNPAERELTPEELIGRELAEVDQLLLDREG